MVICFKTTENFGVMWSIIFPARGSFITQVNKSYLVWALVCFVNEIELYLSLKMYIMVSLSCSVCWATVKLLVLRIVYVRVLLFWGPADCVSKCMKSKVVLIELRINFTCIFKVFTNCPCCSMTQAILWKLKICVNIYPHRPHAITLYERLPSGDAVSRWCIKSY